MLEDYLDPEQRARIDIDRLLGASGWNVQDYKRVNLGAGRGVAVREYKMKDGYEAADYLLFVDRGAVGSIEAKKAGSTLTGVEWQSTKYRQGLPDGISALVKPLPFAFESTGIETRFTNGFDPESASRNVFAFFKPDMLEQWMRGRTTLRGRLHDLPELTRELWIYDLRTNMHFTLKENQLRRPDLDDFVSCYSTADRSKRVETERFHRFTYDDLIARDKASLDITWLRDESLEDAANLPAPAILAAEIVEDLEAALAEFSEVAASLAAAQPKVPGDAATPA